ncbi:MAG: SirA family protein [Syntrophomonadaceae bacterium]|nr:SirA family protein [Syntrophomonadaceae bacterium]
MDILDVRGLSCPLPVLKTQKFLDKGIQELQVMGTGNTAKQNVSKFAKSKGYNVEVTGETVDEWQIIISKKPGL